jgi:nucleoid DNA-binding protein
MIVTRGVLLRSMRRRMPNIRFYDMMYYVNVIVDLLIQRIIDGRIIIVDGFGVLYRRTTKPRVNRDVTNNTLREIVFNQIMFRAHADFKRMIYANDSDFLRQLIKKKSRETIKKRKYRRIV